jgi:hypothetical protein
MHQAVSIIFLLALTFAPQASGWCAGTGQAGQKKETPARQQKSKADSMTGCIDEQEGRYVLIDNRTMSVVAALEADGFPTEGFAKHVGHRVTIRGTVSPDGAVPHFRVRNIVPISDTCAPQPEQGKP